MSMLFAAVSQRTDGRSKNWQRELIHDTIIDEYALEILLMMK